MHGRDGSDSIPESSPRDTPPYWATNLSPSEWPAECPNFLLNVSDKDRGILATKDEDFVRMSWAEVKGLVGEYISAFDSLQFDHCILCLYLVEKQYAESGGGDAV